MINVDINGFKIFNTLTTDRLLPKVLKNAKDTSAKIRLPQSYKVDFWRQLYLFDLLNNLCLFVRSFFLHCGLYSSY